MKSILGDTEYKLKRVQKLHGSPNRKFLIVKAHWYLPSLRPDKRPQYTYKNNAIFHQKKNINVRIKKADIGHSTFLKFPRLNQAHWDQQISAAAGAINQAAGKRNQRQNLVSNRVLFVMRAPLSHVCAVGSKF